MTYIMLKILKIAIPSKTILAPTISYVGAFTSLLWSQRSVAEVSGGDFSMIAIWNSRNQSLSLSFSPFFYYLDKTLGRISTLIDASNHEIQQAEMKIEKVTEMIISFIIKQGVWTNINVWIVRQFADQTRG